MKYRFIRNKEGRRLMAAELDDELQAIESTNEDLDCLSEYFRDMTVIFDIDRYLRLYRVLRTLDKEDREFGKVHINAVIRSVSGSFEYALIDCSLEIYFNGGFDVEAHWLWQNTDIRFHTALAFPPAFYADPVAWFEREIEEKGIEYER